MAAYEAALKQEEAPGTKGPLQSPFSQARAQPTTVSGKEAVSVVNSQPGSQWNITALGATRFPQAPAPDSCLRQRWRRDQAAFRTQQGGPGPWEQQESWLPNVPGAPRMLGLQWRLPSPLSCICDLLSSFKAQKNNYGDTRHRCEMIPLTSSFHSWRSKQDPNNSTRGSLGLKQPLWLREAWTQSLSSRRTRRLGPGLA